MSFHQGCYCVVHSESQSVLSIFNCLTLISKFETLNGRNSSKKECFACLNVILKLGECAHPVRGGARGPGDEAMGQRSRRKSVKQKRGCNACGQKEIAKGEECGGVKR